ncbi:glycosyltransferase family 4 protein [Pontibacter amylolyticus]|uniref:Glycosyl transferase n=1 Tax=Pontibacter amylolyticus TaxID=1424080 RepID=A0ABQ1WCS1_9BACT|nr:glycosyltransferase family 1 protein [Pontibacter amylolyticus]GGG25377.1 glycosyl transferase [Pontibacter amylolyticus]
MTVAVVKDERTSRSIKRYTSLIEAIDNYETYTIPKSKYRLYSLVHKYLVIPAKLAFSKHKKIILPSERYSYLLLFLHHKKVFIVCHDLHDLMDKSSSWWRRCLDRNFIKLLRYSTKIICVSEHTKEDLARIIEERFLSKVTVIHNPVEEFWFENVQINDSKFAALKKRQFILLVGTNAWYKNIRETLKALAKVKSSLIVRVGAVDPDLLSLFEEDQLIQFNGITEKELQWLYQNAALFLLPSIHEGFGWPVLEAMASGCPVVVSDRASIPEVAGDAGLYFSPYDMGQMLKNINKVLLDRDLQLEMSEKGKAIAFKFRFDIYQSRFSNVLNKE